MELTYLIRGSPQAWNGLTIYPVRMRDYPLFLTAKESIEARQQTFPYPFSAMKYLNALYGMPQMFARLCLMLKLALDLTDGNALPLYPRVQGDKLASLLVVQGEVQAEITPKNFPELREIIAAQNGLEIPDETVNSELVEAQRDIAAAGAVPLKVDLESLIYAVALKACVDLEEILNWTVRRFRATEKALDRFDGHRMATTTLAAGGKFKGGNPYPSWKFDREEQTLGIEPLSSLTGRLSGSVEDR